jgi:hypothetical protein
MKFISLLDRNLEKLEFLINYFEFEVIKKIYERLNPLVFCSPTYLFFRP